MCQIKPKNSVLAKSNTLIEAKWSPSIYQNKIIYLAMLELQNGNYEKTTGGLVVTMSGGDIKNFVSGGKKDGDFYSRLKQTSRLFCGATWGLVNDAEKKFEFITVINRAAYEDGKFSLRFAPEVEDHLIGITKNFTLLPLEVVSNLRHKFSFELYQLVKKECFYPSGYQGDRSGIFTISYNFAELKLSLGVIDSNEKGVREVLGSCGNEKPDYEKAVSKATVQKYARWNSFRDSVLKPVIQEINRVSDIQIIGVESTKQDAAGRKEVRFQVTKKNITVPEQAARKDFRCAELNRISSKEKMLFMSSAVAMLKDYVNDFDERDILSLGKASGYQIEKVKKAFDIMQESHCPIYNTVGWLISAMKSDYQRIPGRQAKLGKESKTDYDALAMRELIEKSAKKMEVYE